MKRLDELVLNNAKILFPENESQLYEKNIQSIEALSNM